MAVFTELVGATVILRTGGVYRQVGLARYGADGRLFAKYSGGYVVLHRDNGTSAPKVSWESLEGVETRIVIGKTSLYIADKESDK